MSSQPRTTSRRHAWTAIAIVSLIFAMPLLTLSLLAVTLPRIRAFNVTSLQTSLYAESSRAMLLVEDNATLWNLSSDQNAPSLNSSTGVLQLAGTFPASTQASAFAVSRTLDVNLTGNPIMYMLIKASSGVSYGIRFSSTSSGTVVPLWLESDALNHRPGTGGSEKVQVNVRQLIEMNTGRIFDTVSRVSVYVERSASSQAKPFYLRIQTFEFLNFPLISASALGSYHASYVGLNQIEQGPSSPLVSANIQGRLNASTGAVLVPYFIRGLAVYSGPAYTVRDAFRPFIYGQYHNARWEALFG